MRLGNSFGNEHLKQIAAIALRYNVIRWLSLTKWYEVFEKPTVADAICDRFFHNAHKIKTGETP
jgi:hypothetical protein